MRSLVVVVFACVAALSIPSPALARCGSSDSNDDDSLWNMPAPASKNAVLSMPESPEIVSVERLEHSFACSFTDSYRVVIRSDALTYRVAWDSPKGTGHAVVPGGTSHSRTGLNGDETSIYVVTQDTFYALPQHKVIELGHRSCVGWNIPEWLIDSGEAVGITAIYPGGEELFLGDVVLAKLPPMPAFLNLTPIEAFYVPATRTETVVVRDKSPADTGAQVAAFLAALLFGLVGAPLWRRKPRVAIVAGTTSVLVGLIMMCWTAPPLHMIMAAAAGTLGTSLVRRLGVTKPVV